MATASERNPQRRHPGRRTHLVSSFGSDAMTLGSLSLYLPPWIPAPAFLWLLNGERPGLYSHQAESNPNNPAKIALIPGRFPPGRFWVLLDFLPIPWIPFPLRLVTMEGKELTLWSHPSVAGEHAFV